MQGNSFQVIIIGAGPIGLACALQAKKLGISYLVLEKGALVNSIYNYPVNMTFFSTSERLEIGEVPFVSNNPKPTRPEALEYYRRVTSGHALNVKLYEQVLTVKKMLEKFHVLTTAAEYECENVIIATGFHDIPYLLNVPGEQLAKVTHYYREPHPYAFRKVIVAGAQNSAIDAALETWRKGAEVTMVIRGSEIGKRVKYWVRPDILNRIAEGAIQVFYNSRILEIREHEVEIETPDGRIVIENDHVIAATGYQPDLKFLESVGISLSDDHVSCPTINETTHESNIPGIYLAGVICGGMNTHRLFIENSREHASHIMNHIRSKAAPDSAG